MLNFSRGRPVSASRTLVESASEYKVHPTQICRWEQVLLENAPDLFDKWKKQEAERTVIGEFEAEMPPLSEPMRQMAQNHLASDIFAA